MMGVFGMLGITLMIFALRHVVTETQWQYLENYVRMAFWGLNGGLFLMVVLSLFPGGVLQLLDVLENGYWHARSQDYLGQNYVRLVEWLRLPGDLIFIVMGVLPLVYAVGSAYRYVRQAAAGSSGRIH